MTPSPLAHKLDAARAIERSRGTNRKKVDRVRAVKLYRLSHTAAAEHREDPRFRPWLQLWNVYFPIFGNHAYLWI